MTATIKKKKHPYYDYRKLFSFNAWIMILCGGRGLGKTFGAKKKGITDAIRKGEQFIYLRRTDEEIKDSKLTFFNDIAEFFPDYEVQTMGRVGQIRKRLKRKPDEEEAAFKKRLKDHKWQTVCYFMALSTAQNKKGMSFPLVTLIIFDEFIIERSSHTPYLRSEVEALINFFSTVDRGQDKTKLLMLSNSVSIDNPYFPAWGIEPDRSPEIFTKDNGSIVCHFPDSADYQKSIYQTRFGGFIQRMMPEYGDYAIGNQFRDAHDKLVAEKTKDAKYKYTLETAHGTFSVWYDMRQSMFFILAKRPPNERKFTMLADNMDTDRVLVSFTEPMLKSLRGAFNRGAVYFDKPASRNAFVQIFDRK